MMAQSEDTWVVEDAESLQRELEAYAKSNGVDLFGVADLTPAEDFIVQFGGSFLSNFSRAIALVMKTSDTVVEQLPHRIDPIEHRTVLSTYRAHSTKIGDQLEQVALGIVNIVERAGFRGLPIFRGDVDEENMAGAFSQKLGAHLAGLGWIGKNCLLVSPEYGPRVRLATVLTDAPLSCGEPIDQRCGDCRLCVDVCPAKAFTGVPFDPSEPREARFDAHSCKEYNYKQLALLGVKNRSAPGHACGLCLYVCPFGRKASSKRS